MADNHSPARPGSRSPVRRSSRSPPRRASRSPPRRASRSPPRRSSRSPPRRSSRSPPRQRSPPRRSGDTSNSTTLFVGNLSFNVREKDLFEMMDKVGRVKKVTVGYNRRTGQSSGYAFVEFESRRDAELAFDEFQSKDLQGRRLRVDWDEGLEKKQSRRPPPRRSYGGDRYGDRYNDRYDDRRGGDRYRRSRSPPRRRRTPSRSPPRSPDRNPRKRSRSPSPHDNGDAKRQKLND